MSEMSEGDGDPDGSSGPTRAGIHVLEAPGMFDTMLHLREVGQCKKTDLYRAIGRRNGMAPKLDRLEDAGLLIQEGYQGMTRLSLTEQGSQVADIIWEIQRIIEGRAAREGRAPRYGSG